MDTNTQLETKETHIRISKEVRKLMKKRHKAFRHKCQRTAQKIGKYGGTWGNTNCEF